MTTGHRKRHMKLTESRLLIPDQYKLSCYTVVIFEAICNSKKKKKIK